MGLKEKMPYEIYWATYDEIVSKGKNYEGCIKYLDQLDRKGVFKYEYDYQCLKDEIGENLGYQPHRNPLFMNQREQVKRFFEEHGELISQETDEEMEEIVEVIKPKKKPDFNSFYKFMNRLRMEYSALPENVKRMNGDRMPEEEHYENYRREDE